MSVALLAPAAAHAATSPSKAAWITGACLRDREWTVTVRGRTVKARSPRKRANAYPRWPRYKAYFNDGGVGPVEVSWALNRHERRQTIRCRNRGLNG